MRRQYHSSVSGNVRTAFVTFFVFVCVTVLGAFGIEILVTPVAFFVSVFVIVICANYLAFAAASFAKTVLVLVAVLGAGTAQIALVIKVLVNAYLAN